jgi:putative restriction endonuclease
MVAARVFGHIPSVSVGATYQSRETVATARLHKPTMAGISGAERERADSIVVSGGYEDDEDYVNVIVYTGAGGNVGIDLSLAVFWRRLRLTG